MSYVFIIVSAFDGGFILICSLNHLDSTDRSWHICCTDFRWLQMSPVNLVVVIEQTRKHPRDFSINATSLIFGMSSGLKNIAVALPPSTKDAEGRHRADVVDRDAAIATNYLYLLHPCEKCCPTISACHTRRLPFYKCYVWIQRPYGQLLLATIQVKYPRPLKCLTG